MDTIQKYLEDPAANQRAYLELLDNESVAQYKDYFKS